MISIPHSALLEEQGLYFVYLQTMPEHYVKREVKLGQYDGERHRVLDGLAEGDIVVINGAKHLKIAEASAIIPEGHSHNH